MVHGYEYVIFIIVLVSLQYSTPCSHWYFVPCSSFIHYYIEKFFVKVPSQVCNWILDRFVVRVEVGTTLLVILLTIFYLVFIQWLINCFIIEFIWHGYLTNISVVQDISVLFLWLYHLSFVVKNFFLFLFICVVIWVPRCQVWGEDYCFNFLHVINIFGCKTLSWKIWEYPIQSYWDLQLNVFFLNNNGVNFVRHIFSTVDYCDIISQKFSFTHNKWGYDVVLHWWYLKCIPHNQWVGLHSALAVISNTESTMGDFYIFEHSFENVRTSARMMHACFLTITMLAW